MNPQEQEKIKDQEKVFAKIVEDITKNHRKIIDDWCKAYLAHLVEEGVEIKPNCFTLFHKQPNSLKDGNMVHEYWFELREKQETANDKLLHQVMKKLHDLIDHVNYMHDKLRGDPEKIPALIALDEIKEFLNFVDKEN